MNSLVLILLNLVKLSFSHITTKRTFHDCIDLQLPNRVLDDLNMMLINTIKYRNQSNREKILIIMYILLHIKCNV